MTDTLTDGWTDGTTATLLYPLCNTLPTDNELWGGGVVHGMFSNAICHLYTINFFINRHGHLVIKLANLLFKIVHCAKKTDL